jgi:hypothetical protein
MSSLLFSALQTILRTLIGSLNYERIKVTVQTLDRTDLSGAEKRDAVIEEAKPVIAAVGLALVNLAIEVAVNVLRNKA